jgi:hypothetical protein
MCYRESILVSFQMDPRYPPAGMTEIICHTRLPPIFIVGHASRFGLNIHCTLKGMGLADTTAKELFYDDAPPEGIPPFFTNAL